MVTRSIFLFWKTTGPFPSPFLNRNKFNFPLKFSFEFQILLSPKNRFPGGSRHTLPLRATAWTGRVPIAPETSCVRLSTIPARSSPIHSDQLTRPLSTKPRMTGPLTRFRRPSTITNSRRRTGEPFSFTLGSFFCYKGLRRAIKVPQLHCFHPLNFQGPGPLTRLP